MSATRDTPTLTDYWSVIRRRRRTVATFTVAVVVLAATWVWWSGPTYSSQASVVIRPILSGPFDQSRIDDVGAGTEAKVLDSTVVATLAAHRLHESANDAPALLEQVTVDNPIGTLILNITFDADSPKSARAGAQAFADAYLQHRQQTADAIKARGLDQLTRQRSSLNSELSQELATIASTAAGTDTRTSAEARRDVLVSQITQLETTSSALSGVDTSPGQLIRPADLPKSGSGPSPFVTILGAGALGALLGVGTALVKERTDPRITSRQALTDVLGAEPLAVLPALGGTAAVAVGAEHTGSVASSFRRLRVSVWPRRGSGPHRVLIATPESSTTADTVASNLAVTVSRSGWNVLLAWMTYPVDSSLLEDAEGDEPAPDDAPLEKRIVVAENFEGLSLLPSLSGVDQATSTTDELSESFAELEGQFDIEIVVSAPVLRSPEAFELCPVVDATILVFDVTLTTRAELERCIEALSSTGTPIAGVVAVAVPPGW